MACIVVPFVETIVFVLTWARILQFCILTNNQNKVTFQSVLPIQVVATLLDAVIVGQMITALETTFLKNREWRT